MGRSRSVFTTLKIAVFAPIPRARVIMATMAKPGLWHRVRTPYRTSCQKVSIAHLDATCAQGGKSHASRLSSEVKGQDQLSRVHRTVREFPCSFLGQLDHILSQSRSPKNTWI